MNDTWIEYYKGIETDEDGNQFWYPVVKSTGRPRVGKGLHEEL